MSLLDSEITQLNNLDKVAANISLNEIITFIAGYMPEDIYYNSFTNQNRKDIIEHTDYRFITPLHHSHQFTYHINIKSTFYHIPYKSSQYHTYTLETSIKCASLELVHKKGIYYICPNYVGLPIIIDGCGLSELPNTIKFAKKNPKSKTPLTFILRNGGETCKWIKDLPKGSIVYVIPSAYMTIDNWNYNTTSYDFTKSKDFQSFVEMYGYKKIIK